MDRHVHRDYATWQVLAGETQLQRIFSAVVTSSNSREDIRHHWRLGFGFWHLELRGYSSLVLGYTYAVTCQGHFCVVSTSSVVAQLHHVTCHRMDLLGLLRKAETQETISAALVWFYLAQICSLYKESKPEDQLPPSPRAHTFSHFASTPFNNFRSAAGL